MTDQNQHPETLPPELQELVARLLASADLNEAESEAVGRELCSHLADGLGSGRPVDELIAEFGDVDVSAELISRSRQRLRRSDGALPPEVVYQRGGGHRSFADGLRADASYAIRSLTRSPGFTLVAVLTLALGVGVNTAIFSAARATMLSSLPLPDADRLVRIYFENPGGRTNVPHIDFREWSGQDDLFAALATYAGVGVDLEDDPPVRIFGTRVSEDFFDVFQSSPVVGRTFTPEEFREGAEDVVVLAAGLWATRFDSDPGVIGTTVRLSGRPRTVVGVVDGASVWPNTASFWVPDVLTAASREARDRRDNYAYSPLGRLQPGVSIDRAQTKLREMSQRVAADNPAMREGMVLGVDSLRDWIVGTRLPSTLTMLLAATTFVFLIACTNVAGLLVTRASSRRRQFAVRVAMGARPWQLARHVLAESLLLFLLGGGVGIVVASLTVDAVVAAAPTGIPRLAETRVDTSEFLFALSLAAVAGLIFGLYPALRARSESPVLGLKESIGASETRSSGHVRRGLVVAEVALSTALLVGAGLMIRSLDAINGDDPGFQRDHLLTFFMSPPASRYAESADVDRLYEELTERLAAQPGVETAATSTFMPIGGGGIGLTRAHLAPDMPEPPAGPEYTARWVVVDPMLFETLGWPLLRGRTFARTDDAASPPVAIMSQSMVEQMFAGEDPIGRQVRSWRDENIYREVVGIVGDVRLDSVTDQMEPLFIVPSGQIDWDRFRSVVMRTQVEPETLLPQLQGVVSEIDPLLPVNTPRTGDSIFRASVAASEFTTLLLGLFAILGLLVASVGLYGVLSSNVASRTRELGIRTALGAGRGATVSMVVRQGLVMAAAGLGVGLVAVLLAGDLMGALLFEVSVRDPVTLTAVTASLVGVSLLASWLPARRATAIDPVRALKME